MSGAPRRMPVRPDEASRLLYEASLAQQRPFDLEDWTVTVYPPKGGRGNWRVLYTTPSGRGELSGGRRLDQLHAAVLAAVEIIRRRTELRADQPVGTLIDDYLTQHLATSWDGRTFHDRRRDLAGLREVTKGVACADLDLEHLRNGVQRAGTAKRGKFL
ncbi:MAG TPA: hypothetical protein VFS29_13495, partial [Motilibacteraceae bacterium]|nr:hypothetical protein [Motilibacteraceae bacterium]